MMRASFTRTKEDVAMRMMLSDPTVERMGELEQEQNLRASNLETMT